MEEDERDRRKREGEEEKKGEEEVGDLDVGNLVVGDLLKVSDIEKFKKLPSNLTLSILSPELNKSF